MAISEHPPIGTILFADFDRGFKEPEMVKRRPVVVVSPKIGGRNSLCTVVALSTSEPRPRKSYHCQIDINPPLPEPWESERLWVKGDMVYALGFHRLDLVRIGKRNDGKRVYRYETLNADQIREIRVSMLHGIGLHSLVKHL